jgi:hypothetical protein
MERVAGTSARVAIVSADQCTTNTAGATRIREIKGGPAGIHRPPLESASVRGPSYSRAFP